MSRTVPLQFEDDWVWAVDDALSVYVAHLAEALGASPTAGESWNCKLIASLQPSAVVGDYGVTIHPATRDQRCLIREAVGRAREGATRAGDVGQQSLTHWTFDAFDGLPVAGGHSRTGEAVELERVLEVADALERMMDGTVPERPAHQRWLVGNGGGWAAIQMRETLSSRSRRSNIGMTPFSWSGIGTWRGRQAQVSALRSGDRRPVVT